MYTAYNAMRPTPCVFVTTYPRRGTNVAVATKLTKRNANPKAIVGCLASGNDFWLTGKPAVAIANALPSPTIMLNSGPLKHAATAIVGCPPRAMTTSEAKSPTLLKKNTYPSVELPIHKN